MTWKVSIHDSLRHKYTVFSTRICALNYFASVKPIRKAATSTKSKAVQFSPIPLDVHFFPTQTVRLPHGVFSTRICASNYFASTDNSNLANLSGKLLHPRKAKRYSFHPYRLMFIFSQRRQHGCHRAFSLPEFVRRIAPPVWIDFHHANPSKKLLHPRKTKRQGFHPYRLMFIFCQRRRHDCHMAFSLLESVHRIISPVQTIPTLQAYPGSCYISRKTKAVQFPPIPLDVYFLPTQTARLPQGVFSARICASNRSASVKPIRKAATSHAKQKRLGFHPYRLTFIFSQSRRHDCRRAFSLLESVHRIISPVQTIPTLQTYPESCYIHEKQSGRASTHTA